MTEFANRGVLKPLDFAKDTIAANYSPDWIKLTTVNGHALRPRVQGRQQVDGLVQRARRSRTPASRRPQTGTQLLQDAKTLKASGVKAYSIGADVGWPLTDLFENIYLRTAGGDMYDKLTAHDHPVDRPVGDDGSRGDGAGLR